MGNKKNVLTHVLCPLVDRVIEDIDCIENRDIIDGMFKMTSLPEEYKQKKDFISICKACEYHDY